MNRHPMKPTPLKALAMTSALAALSFVSAAPSFATGAVPDAPVVEPAPTPGSPETSNPAVSPAPTTGKKDPDVIGDVTVAPMEAYPGEKVRVTGECRYYGIPGARLSIGVYSEALWRSYEFAPEITMEDGYFDVEVSLPHETVPGTYDVDWACELDDTSFASGTKELAFVVLRDPSASNAGSASGAAASSAASASATSDSNGTGMDGTSASDGRGTANPTTPAPGTTASTKPTEELAETGTNPSGAAAIVALAGTALGAGLLLRRRTTRA